MTDIELIKNGVKYADGFEFIRKQDDDEHYVGFDNRAGDYFSVGNYDRFVYPLFLQRVIEGINKEGVFEVVQYCNRIEVYEIDNSEYVEIFYFGGETPIDQAKRSAIEYVLEQEGE